MKIRRKLLELARAVADEAERNPEFALKLGTVLGLEHGRRHEKEPRGGRSRRRRAPAVFDPVAVLRERDDQELRSRLLGLDLEQLKDMVAQYGMDPGKLVMKWKNRERVADRIVEISAKRAQKGDAFREDARMDRVPERSGERSPGARNVDPTD